jgi:hypothetical protein
MNLIQQVQQLASLSRDFSRTLSQIPNTGTLEPQADPYKTQSQHLLALGSSPRFRYGMIVDYVPHVRMYRVQPDGGGPLLLCTRLTSLGTSPVGVADGDALTPGDRVLLAQNPRSFYGEIVSVLPGLAFDPRLVKADYIVQGSNVGILADSAHRAGFLMGRENTFGGIANFGPRMPIDSLAGEFCRSTETGLMLFLDAAMGFLRVDELCGLWMFYRDQLLRLAGYNMQQWSCASELEIFDDEGELQYYHGLAVYPWEQLGQFRQPREITTEQTAKKVQQEQPWLGGLEPNNPDLKPFHRIQQFAGYLGQGSKTLVVAPSPEAEHHLYGYDIPQIGLAEAHQLLSGHLLWRSAKGLILTKRPTIPVPHRARPAADARGDTAADYKASGFFGNGPEHKLSDGPQPADDSEHPTQVKLATLQDQMAYLFNWAGLAGVQHHRKDFKVPQEGDGPLTTNQEVPEFSVHKNKPYLPTPEPVEVEIDHRHKVKIYPNNSYIALLDEGGIAIGDGYGAELKLANGHAEITTALDCRLSCGRTLQLWGGRDVVVRAKQSIDLTATKHDIRLMANNNIQIIGANGGGAHGILIESRSAESTYNFEKPGHDTQHGGIMLRTPNAPLVWLVQNAYLRSDNNITLDANEAGGNLVIRCAREEVFVSSSVTHYFGSEDQVNSVNVWQDGRTLLGGSLHVNGELSNRGNHVLQGNVLVTQGHIFTENGNEKVARLEGPNLSQAAQFVDTGSRSLQLVTRNGRQVFQTNLQDPWYADGKAGNDAVRERASGSLRTAENYGTTEFALFEPRWGQMARLGGQTVGDWNETAVAFNGEDTFCYPGKENFSADVFYAVGLNLFDTERGVSKTRGAAYEDAKLDSPNAGSLHAYPTIE